MQSTSFCCFTIFSFNLKDIGWMHPIYRLSTTTNESTVVFAHVSHLCTQLFSRSLCTTHWTGTCKAFLWHFQFKIRNAKIFRFLLLRPVKMVGRAHKTLNYMNFINLFIVSFLRWTSSNQIDYPTWAKRKRGGTKKIDENSPCLFSDTLTCVSSASSSTCSNECETKYNEQSNSI